MAGERVPDHEGMPEKATQILNAYNENHQIAAFLQDMLTCVFRHLPVDPYEFMLEYIARHKPAAPPLFSSLWVRSSDASNLPHAWRMQRCWVTRDGVLCITDPSASLQSADVTSSLPSAAHMDSSASLQSADVTSSLPSAVQQISIHLEDGLLCGKVSEDEAVKPFAFNIGDVEFAAQSEGQREMWLKMVEVTLARRVSAAVA